MIKQFFGFKTLPFAKDIDTKNIFLSNSMKELFSRLEYIKQNRGIMLLTGEPGTGKTLAIRHFFQELNQNCYLPIYTPLSTVSQMEFYRQLCFKLTGDMTYFKWLCFEKIQKGIIDFVNNSKKVPVIIIDEAHLLKGTNLSEIQIILNFEIDSVNPVIFILVGQTFLRDIVSRPVHLSLNRRFTLKYNIIPLEKTEIKNYVVHHLKIAGVSKEIFSDSAIEAIFNNTGGNPGTIANLASKALALAVSENKYLIQEEEIYNASKEL